MMPFSRRVARLNDRQSNRLQDTQLTEQTDQDDAWRIMVERGRRQMHLPNTAIPRAVLANVSAVPGAPVTMNDRPRNQDSGYYT
jgi:uncharacterized membrane protein YcjF (UPF0283 family)